MPRKQPPIAKLTRPRQLRVLARPRLYSLIEQARASKALWISGPPGSGKTTLVAAYLDAHKLDAIWYQADSGDSDPATFFYFLTQAAARGRAARTKLPLLKPEYQKDLPRFSRRYFRQLFESAGQGWILVLDNYQEIDPASAVHSIVRHAIEETPERVSTILISRNEPPPEFALLAASQLLERIDWRAMAFNREETRAFAELRGARITDEELHQRSGGWAAGLVLMLANQSPESGSMVGAGDAIEAIFSYFAEEILNKADKPLRDFLMQTAFLPRLTAASAAAISGNLQAGKLLEELYRRHLFVDRRGEQETVYQFHDLFRSFLQRRVSEQFSKESIAAIQRRAARLLESGGLTEDAMPLYLAAGDIAAAASLIDSHAARLLAQGRGQTLRNWICALPKSNVEGSPRLQYLWGLSLIATDQKEAREHLERAYAGFLSKEDAPGQTLAVAGIIDSILREYGNLNLLDGWIAAIGHLVPQQSELLEPDDQLHIYSTLVAAFTTRHPAHPLLPFCRDRTRTLIGTDIEPNLRVTAGSHLVYYCSISGEPDLVREVVRIVSPLLRNPEVSPISNTTWRVRLAYYLSLAMDYDQARRLADEAQAIAGTHGFFALEAFIYFIYTHIDLARAEIDAAAARLERWKALARLEPSDLTYWNFCRSYLAYARGDMDSALELARAVAASAERGAPVLPRVAAGALLSVLLTEKGDFGAALDLMQRLRSDHYGTPFKRIDALIDSAHAYVALLSGDMSQALPALRRFFSQAREHRLVGPFGPLQQLRVPEIRLIEAALRAGIEVPYVQSLIRQRGLAPESMDVPDWPWPIRVFTLGRFLVQSGGKPVGTGHKAQRKPLELLGVLIAKGGRGVSAAEIAAELWPDAEGDAGQASFENALHRLRKLLGHAKAVQLQDGRLSLDPQCVWVDAWAFEQLARTAEQNAERNPSEFGSAARSAIESFAGQFLEGEPERPWMVAMREKLRLRFVRLAIRLGEHLDAVGAAQDARKLYEHALRVENLAEPIYQRLIRSYLRSGERAEAMQTYRRCRELLEIALGVAPAPETQALYRELRDG